VPCAVNLFEADSNGPARHRCNLSRHRITEAGRGVQPVPTAVPPMASFSRPRVVCLNFGNRVIQGSDVAGPLLPHGQWSGVFQMCTPGLDDIGPLSRLTLGIRRVVSGARPELVFCVVIVCAAMCMAVGNVSLLDWPHVHLVVRCDTGFLRSEGAADELNAAVGDGPRSRSCSIASPTPVCTRMSGNSVSSDPLMTSSHTLLGSDDPSIRAYARHGYSRSPPLSSHTRTRDTPPSAMRSLPMLKCCRLRCVWAPQ